MIHRAIFGSLERFFGILIENYAGDFPLWLAPVQVRVLVVSDRFRDYAQSIVQSLRQQNIRAEVDNTGERLGKQIRNSELDKIPVTVVIGQRELDNQSLSVRTRSLGDMGTMTLPQLTEEILQAIANKFSSY